MAYGSRTEKIILDGINRGGKGRPYENLMASAMAAYCVKNGLDFEQVTGTDEDLFEGTDFKIYNQLDIITARSGVLRLDFTAAFSHKDNMPMLWVPQSKIEQLPGKPLQFGIRTGNAVQGFAYPVVAVGIDASRNRNPDDDVDVDLLSGQIQANALKHAGAIISEAGAAMAVYMRETEPRYAAWLQGEHGPDAFFPDYDALIPNLYGLSRFNTKKPTDQTNRGLSLAKNRALEYMLGHTAGSHEFELAKQFAHGCSALAKPPRGRRPSEGSWQELLEGIAKAREWAKESKKEPDGLTR